MVEAAGGRAAIATELITLADSIIAQWDTAEVLLDEPEKNYTAKKVEAEDGIVVTLIKYRVEGLTEQQWETWSADPSVVSAAVNPKLTRIELPDDEGHKVRLLKMKMPMMITNRSTLTTFYRQEKEDGTKLLFHSSKGNENLIAANADQIGSDVSTNNVLTYMAWKPYEGGMDLTHIVKMDPAGSIPDFIKKKAAARLANSLQIIVNYVKDGTVPEPLF